MKILFIGNSYTYYNDLPKIFTDLARCNNKDVQADSVTKGGRKLYENLSDGDEKRLIIDDLLSKNEYDILFLQEQSYLPLVNYEAFEHGVSGLINIAKAKRNILYATWGRKSGCPLLEEHGWTCGGMGISLNDAYRQAATKFEAEVSPVGLCFKYIVETYPDLELYNPDYSHPSYLGSCIAAITHYKTVFNEIPKDISAFESTIPKPTLNLIIKAISETLK